MIIKRQYFINGCRCLFKDVGIISITILLLISSGCAHFSSAGKVVNKINPFNNKREDGKPALTAYDLQLELMRFADDFSSMAGEVSDVLAAKAKTPRDRIRPIAMKISQANAAVSIASDPNPVGGIMDMAVLVTLTRMSFEDTLVPKVYGEEANGVVEKYKKAEAEIWHLVSQVLDAKQQAELKKSIDQWRIENPDQRYVSYVRLQNLYKPELAVKDDSKSPGSIFSLLFIDPFAGLDPAAREMEMSRHTAERAMYQFQRMPRMLDWQLSLVIVKTLALPEIQAMISSIDRFSKAAEALPGKITEERVALVKAMETNEPKLKGLLTEMHETLEAGEKAADAVNDTVQALDCFIGGFENKSVPEKTNAPPSKPFDVTEYGTSATQIGGAAREMNALVNSIDQKMLPHTEATIAHAKSAGTELVDYIFRRAVTFVLIALVAAVAAMISYRAIAARFPKGK